MPQSVSFLTGLNLSISVSSVTYVEGAGNVTGSRFAALFKSVEAHVNLCWQS
jgi:hypothetical protein